MYRISPHCGNMYLGSVGHATFSISQKRLNFFSQEAKCYFLWIISKIVIPSLARHRIMLFMDLFSLRAFRDNTCHIGENSFLISKSVFFSEAAGLYVKCLNCINLEMQVFVNSNAISKDSTQSSRLFRPLKRYVSLYASGTSQRYYILMIHS